LLRRTAIETFRLDAPGTTLEAVFDQHRKDPSGRIESAVLRPDFFVISGKPGGVKKFFVRAAIKNGEVRGQIIRYDLSTQGTFARLDADDRCQGLRRFLKRAPVVLAPAAAGLRLFRPGSCGTS